ncbi:type II secretion system F family protein [Aurantiacibacter rhizosphaerae]|uniref:Type II secretion system F family protein n=1 Tax=Aurantiacibacter rhizosphaerae TaxID=2691582 RepID=A0A844XH99_9SPHN|nr:type II secretion system F family protein [Aurantiacibacter rhizosphaerae]MWV28944.1 type II secretion system F family protein [Aurantiacibacter rhizosphaerae]
MLEQILASAILRSALLIGLFVLVVVASFSAMAYYNRRSAIRGGLLKIRDDVVFEERKPPSHKEENASAWSNIVDAVERAGLHLGDSKDQRLRERLVAAGYTSPSAPRVYTLVRLALIFVLPGLYLLVALTRPEPPGFLALYIFGSLLGLMGLFLPSLFVQAKADRRRETIVNGFPDALDLMLVCMEAGLGVEAAIDRVAREMASSHPLVATLLGTAVLQLRAGATRQEAFRRMADAAGVDEIRSFTTLLVQSDKLGTSVSSTLRVYAEEMREKRRMRAEEKAHRLPVLISIPLVVFMLPTMIGVVMLPAAIRMMRDIFPMMTG